MPKYDIIEVIPEMHGMPRDLGVPAVGFVVKPPIEMSDRLPIQFAVAEGLEAFAKERLSPTVFAEIGQTCRVGISQDEAAQTSTVSTQIGRADRSLLFSGVDRVGALHGIVANALMSVDKAEV